MFEITTCKKRGDQNHHNNNTTTNSTTSNNGNITFYQFDCTHQAPINGSVNVTIYDLFGYKQNFTFSSKGSLEWVLPHPGEWAFIVSAKNYYSELSIYSYLQPNIPNITLECLTRIENQTVEITITDCATSKPLSVPSTFEWANPTYLPPLRGNLTVPAGGKVNWTVLNDFFPDPPINSEEYLRWAINASGYLYYQNTSAVLNSTTSLNICAQPPQDIYIDIQYNKTSIQLQNATEIKWLEACGLGCELTESFHPPSGSMQWQNRTKLTYGGYGYLAFIWNSVGGYEPYPYSGTIVEINRNTTQITFWTQ